MTMPNFFIVGAQKAGTTSLYQYLNQHPQVYMSPIKEPFFDHEMDSKGVVRREFEGIDNLRGSPISRSTARCSKERGVRGDRRGDPLVHLRSGDRRAHRGYVPGAKSIALLRNPADRAYSAFLYALRMGVEPLTDFAQALREEPFRVQPLALRCSLPQQGLYYQQLKRITRSSEEGARGVALRRSEEDPAGVAQSVFRFLEVDDTFAPDASSSTTRPACERIRPRRDEGNEQGGLGPRSFFRPRPASAARLRDASSGAEPGPHRAAADPIRSSARSSRGLRGRHPEAAGAHRADLSTWLR